MMEPENYDDAGNRTDPADAAADAEFRRWADAVVPLPAPPYGFERVLVRAHRRKVRRRMVAATASMLSVAVLFGGLIAGGVLPGLAGTGSNCPSAATAPNLVKGSAVNRRTEYAIGGALAATALTAGVLAGCTGNSANGPTASGTGQSVSPSAASSTGGQLTLPSVTASSGATSSPTTQSSTGTAVPQCQTADMTATVAEVAGSEGAGSASLNITLTNTSGHSCSVYGFPGLGLEDKNEDKQPTTVTWDPAIAKTVVTLANGASASSTARFDADVPGPGEPTSGACEPSSEYMLVTPPNNQSQLVARIGGTGNAGVTVCESGALQVFALVPGTTGPNQ